MTKKPPELVRASATARRMGASTRTLVAAAERGELPGLVPVQIGKLKFFRADAVESFLAGATAQQGAAQ